MSQEKVDKYKIKKLLRNIINTIQKNKEKFIVAAVILFVAVVACCYTYTRGFSNGHNNGYNEAKSLYFDWAMEKMASTSSTSESTTPASETTTPDVESTSVQ